MASKRKVAFITTKVSDTIVDPPFPSATDLRTSRLKRPGFVDGRYELVSMISNGGMGKVYKARHRDLGKEVAIKLVLDGYKDNQRFREMFFREARLASSLSHPGIVSVTDFGLDEDLGYFVVMELLEGETLYQWLESSSKPMRRRFEIFDQVVEAVRYMHKRGIVHCDLKPPNIFIVKAASGVPSRVKLLDFGLSWRQETAPDDSIAGTPLYIAPERMNGGPPTPACDVYSLGVILYELVTEKQPFSGGVVELIAKKVMGEFPVLPSTIAVEAIDQRIDSLIMKALATEPLSRHSSVEAFHYELRALMNMMGFKSKGRRK